MPCRFESYRPSQRSFAAGALAPRASEVHLPPVMRREFLIALAISLAVLAGGLVVYQWTAAPTTLKVAVGPMGSENTRLVVALQQYMARERSTVRLRLVLTEGVDASAKAVEDDKADLAIVRTDVAMPVKAQTVAIMHRDAALLMTTPDSGISKVSGLYGRNVGVVREIAANRTLLETGLAHYEIPRDSVVIVTLGANEVEEALRTKRVDAVLAVGTVTGRTMTETVAAVSQAANMAPVFIPIDEADAIAQRSPKFESLEVVRGSFGGTPPRPMATVETLGVSHRLVAKTSLDDNIVSELTKVLFTARPTLAQEVALANKIEAPDTAKGSALPVHSGATAYYEGEVQTFFERYGDWLYLIIMVLSIGGSGIAAMASSAANRARARNMELLRELLAIVRRAHEGGSIAALDALDREADDILGMALAKAGSGGIDNAGVAAFTLGLDQARRAIGERRRILLAHGGEAHGLAQAAE
ncbi:MAG: TAXI family TRAP transporter solute-binding subunit [Microvirga sp.]